MSNVPECWCNEDLVNSCEWEVAADIRFNLAGHDDKPSSQVSWKLRDIPQPLAQALFHLLVDACNTQGAEAYLEWLSGCYGPDDPKVARTRAILDVIK